MPRFALVQGGRVVNVVLADDDWTPPPGLQKVALNDGVRAGPGWAFNGTAFAEPEAPAGDTRISKRAFRDRFTDAEKVAIEIAAIDNPTGQPAQRQLQARLRAMLRDIDAATFIDLSHPSTRAGVQALQAAGLIGPGRAAAILDTPVADSERPPAIALSGG